MAYIKERGNNNYLIRICIGTDEKGRPIQRSRSFHASSTTLSKPKLQKEMDAFIYEFEKECCDEYTKSQKHCVSKSEPVVASVIPIAQVPQIQPKNSMVPTFRAFLDDYKKAKRDGMSPTTWLLYETSIEKILLPMFGDMHLNEIRPLHLQQMINYLSSPEGRTDGKGKYLAPATIRRYLTIMQSILTFAYKLEYIENNPADSRRLEIPKIQRPEVEAYSDDEIDDIFIALDKEPINIKLLISIAFYTGARRGEIVGIKWDDIDFENRTIYIRRSIYKVKNDPPQEKLPKTNSSIRTISIPDTLCQLLHEYRTAQDNQKQRFGSKWYDGNYIFTEFDGHVMNPQTPTKQFNHFLKRHGIRHLKFHGLRHTSATWLLSHGCDIKTVSMRLGHTSIDTTNIYVHALKKTDRMAADKFDMLTKRS